MVLKLLDLRGNDADKTFAYKTKGVNGYFNILSQNISTFFPEKIIDPANEKLTTFLKRTMSSIIFQHMKMVHIFQKQKRSRSFP